VKKLLLLFLVFMLISSSSYATEKAVKQYTFSSNENKKEFTVVHGIETSHISFMASFDMGGTPGYVSRQCIYNQKELIFSFDIPFKLDATVWECTKVIQDNDNPDIRLLFGDSI
jgi:hypothetical protein